MRDFAAKIDRLPGRPRETIRSAHAEIFERIEAASWGAWLPVEVNVALTDAVYAALGRGGGDAFFLQLQLGQFDTPTWRSFIQGALAILGVDPGSLAKWLPRAVGLMFRHCGVWTVERLGPSQTRVSIAELPACCSASSYWPLSVRSAITSIYSLTHCKGVVEIGSLDAAARSARYELRWEAAEG